MKFTSFCLFFLGLLSSMAAAADSTWTGGAGANWNDGGNWNTLPNAGDTLIFTGVANPSTNNDFTPGTSFGGITFDNLATDGEFTLAGNDIVLGGNLLTLGATGTPNHVISLNLSLDGDRTVTTALDNDLTLSGIISEDASARSLTKIGDGILRVSNANTYSGGSTVTSGTMRVENVDGLGTGGVTLNGGRLVFVADSNTTFNNVDVNVTANSTLVSDRFTDGAGSNHTLGNLTIGSQTLTVDSSGGNSSSGTALMIVGGTTTLNGGTTFQVDNTAGAGSAGFQTTGITGTGGFTKTGNGLMVMAGGTYNYDGNAVLDNGTLRVTGGNNLQNTTFVNGGTLELRNLNGARQTDIMLSGGSLDLRNNSATTFTTKTLTVTAGNLATIESRDINGTIDGLEHILSSDGIILQAGSTLRFTNFEDFDLKVDAPGGGVPSILLEGDATLDVRSTSLVTIVGPIEDGGNGYGLTISSNLLTNTLVLEAPSTYGGNTQFRSAGTNTSHVRLGVDNALPHGADKGDIDMALAGGEARIDLNGFNQTVNGLFDTGLGVIDNSHATNASTLTVGDNDGGGTFTGQLIDSGAGGLSLVKTGAGLWLFGGTGDYDGTTTVSAGTLQLGTQIALYNNTPTSWTAANLSVSSGATLALSVGGTDEFTSADVDTLKLLGDAGAGGFGSGARLGIDASNAPSSSFTYSTVVGDINSGSNVIGIDVLGTGTLVLDADNTYTGGTRLRSGVLQAGHIGALGTGDITFQGGTLQYTASTSGTDWSARIVNSTGAVAIDTGDQNVTLADIIDSSNSGGLNKIGIGNLTLGGANTFTGNVILTGINGGVSRLIISSDSNLGDVNNDIIFDGPSNPDLEITTSLTLPATRSVQLNSSGGGEFLVGGSEIVTLDGQVTGAGNLRKQLSGTLVVANASNDFSGDIIGIAGTLSTPSIANVGVASPLGTGNRIQLGNASGSDGILEHTGSGADATDRQIQVGGGTSSNHNAGSQLLINGTGSVTFTNSAFNIAQTDAIASRILTLGGSNTTANTIQGVIADNDTTGGGTIGIEKTGSNTWMLAGDSTYTGTTTVTDGTLLVNGDLSAATGDLTVAADGTLGGSGTIGGSSTILGVHTPGTSPGLQTFANDLSYGPGAQVYWELADNAISGRGTAFDGIDVLGSLAFDGGTTLNLVFDSVGSIVDWSDTLFWGADQSWLIWGVSSAASSFGNLSLASTDWLDADSNNFGSLGTFSLREDTGGIFLDFTNAVPEPSRAVLILISLFGTTLRRRRTTR